MIHPNNFKSKGNFRVLWAVTHTLHYVKGGTSAVIKVCVYINGIPVFKYNNVNFKNSSNHYEYIEYDYWKKYKTLFQTYFIRHEYSLIELYNNKIIDIIKQIFIDKTPTIVCNVSTIEDKSLSSINDGLILKAYRELTRQPNYIYNGN